MALGRARRASVHGGRIRAAGAARRAAVRGGAVPPHTARPGRIRHGQRGRLRRAVRRRGPYRAAAGRPARQLRAAGSAAGSDALGNRRRHRDPRPAAYAQQDLLGRLERLWRRAEHASVRDRHHAARHAAGSQLRRRRARHPLRSRGEGDDQPALDHGAKELLLPRSPEGLPDQPVRNADRSGWFAENFPGGVGEGDSTHPRPSRGGRRQIAARSFPRHERLDLNRAGTPLLEIVSEPDLRGAQEAVAYARALPGS